MTPPPSQDRVLIVGAGIGGLSLAQGLHRRGIPFDVYERDVDAAKDSGYGLLLLTDGVRALAHLVPPEMLSFLHKVLHVPGDIGYANCAFDARDKRCLFKFNVEKHTKDLDSLVQKDRMLSRGSLQNILLMGIEEHVHFDRAVSAFEENDKGSVKFIFKDGRTTEGRVLVGADGVHSVIRKQKFPENDPEKLDVVMIASRTSLKDEKVRSLLPADMEKQSLNFLVGGSSKFGGVVPSYWASDPFANLSPEERLRFLGNRDGSQPEPDSPAARLKPFMADSVTFSIAGLASTFSQTMQKGKASPEELLEEFVRDAEVAGWHPDLIEIVRLSDPESRRVYFTRLSEEPKQGSLSNVTMLGDSIHAMPPFLGRGANTALEDAWMLTQELDHAWPYARTFGQDAAVIETATSQKHLREGIVAYEEKMRKNATRWMKASSDQHKRISSLLQSPLRRPIFAVGLAAGRLIGAVPFLHSYVISKMRAQHGYQD